MGLLQEDLHHRHQGHPGRGGGVDTEPGHVSTFSSTVNMMIKVSIFRERCCVHNNTLYPVDMIIRTVDTPDNCTRACSKGRVEVSTVIIFVFRFINNAPRMRTGLE